MTDYDYSGVLARDYLTADRIREDERTVYKFWLYFVLPGGQHYENREDGRFYFKTKEARAIFHSRICAPFSGTYVEEGEG